MLTFPGYVENGEIALEIDGCLIPYNGYKCQVKVVKDTIKRKRSISQNSYFHGVIIPLILQAFHETGAHIQDNAKGEPRPVTFEIIKEMLKDLFAPRDLIILPNGDTISTVRSTTDLDTAEFMEFCDKCRAFAAEYLDCNIPDPQ
jgi:hypothetical protein